MAAVRLGGCDRGGEVLVPVQGNITLRRGPITEGAVSFRPDGEKGNHSLHHPTGHVDAQGNYRLYTRSREGAPPGWYKVVVFVNEPTPDDPAAVHPGMPKTIIHRRYNQPETTPLSVEVKPDADPAAYNFTLDPAR